MQCSTHMLASGSCAHLNTLRAAMNTALTSQAGVELALIAGCSHEASCPVMHDFYLLLLRRVVQEIEARVWTIKAEPNMTPEK
eukprot:4336222-Amphidinium_carterae.1